MMVYKVNLYTYIGRTVVQLKYLVIFENRTKVKGFFHFNIKKLS